MKPDSLLSTRLWLILAVCVVIFLKIMSIIHKHNSVSCVHVVKYVFNATIYIHNIFSCKYPGSLIHLYEGDVLKVASLLFHLSLTFSLSPSLSFSPSFVFVCEEANSYRGEMSDHMHFKDAKNTIYF